MKYGQRLAACIVYLASAGVLSIWDWRSTLIAYGALSLTLVGSWVVAGFIVKFGDWYDKK